MRLHTLSAIAIAAVASAPAALAQTETGSGDGSMQDRQMAQSGESGVVSASDLENAIRSEHVIGGDLYAFTTDSDDVGWDETVFYDAIEADWENVGEIEDVMFSRDGQVIGLVAEVGGFLDIGDDRYVVDLRDVKFVDDGVGDLDLVTRLSLDEIESRPEVEADTWF